MSETSANSGPPGDRNNSLNAVDLVFEFVGNDNNSDPPTPASLRFVEELRERYLRGLACQEQQGNSADEQNAIIEQ